MTPLESPPHSPPPAFPDPPTRAGNRLATYFVIPNYTLWNWAVGSVLSAVSDTSRERLTHDAKCCRGALPIRDLKTRAALLRLLGGARIVDDRSTSPQLCDSLFCSREAH